LRLIRSAALKLIQQVIHPVNILKRLRVKPKQWKRSSTFMLGVWSLWKTQQTIPA
jgi:hypothetical protein